MTNEEREKKIREGWVTNYPNPNFKGDKIACLISIKQGQEDISFLLDRLKAKKKRIEELEGLIRKSLDFTRHRFGCSKLEHGDCDCGYQEWSDRVCPKPKDTQ